MTNALENLETLLLSVEHLLEHGMMDLILQRGYQGDEFGVIRKSQSKYDHGNNLHSDSAGKIPARARIRPSRASRRPKKQLPSPYRKWGSRAQEIYMKFKIRNQRFVAGSPGEAFSKYLRRCRPKSLGIIVAIKKYGELTTFYQTERLLRELGQWDEGTPDTVGSGAQDLKGDKNEYAR